jgi:hypothetical protein
VPTLSSSITGVGRVALFLGVWVASCSPFEANSADGADAGVADAAASDPVGAPDQSSVDGGGAADSADADALADGSVPADGGTFCGTFTNPIRCFDFDESNPPAGFVFDQSGGTLSFATTFAPGSPPKALVLKSTVAGGKNTATVDAISLVPYKDTTVTVAFLFSVTTLATSTEYIARLNFVGSSASITVDASGIRCGTPTAVSLVPGGHSVTITMPVNGVGAVTSLTCIVDSALSVTASISPASQAVGVELGNVSSTSGAFTTAYDNVVVRAQ